MAFDFLRLFGPDAANRLLQPVQNASGAQNFLANPQSAQAAPPLPPPVEVAPAPPVASPAPDLMQTASVAAPVAQAAPRAAQAAQKPGLGLNKEFLQDMFLGWAMGQTPMQSLALGAAQASKGKSGRKNVNETVEWLKGRGVDEATAKQMASNQTVLADYLKNMNAQAKPLEINGKLVDPTTYQVIADFSNQTTDTQRNLEFRAREAGLVPNTPEYQKFMASGGDKGINVNVDTGTIPQGYEAIRDNNGRVIRYEPIPGGPADTTKTDAARADSLSASTDVITGAASKAREAYNSATLPVTGTVGRIAGMLPETNSAEVRRQVETLKSNAKIENLQAMRAASPTGGALGAVSDSENAMLAAKAGALDPDSPNFARDLDDYERSLLRTIHGKEAGDAIFEQSRSAGDGGSADPLGIR